MASRPKQLETYGVRLHSHSHFINIDFMIWVRIASFWVFAEPNAKMKVFYAIAVRIGFNTTSAPYEEMV